MNGRTAENVGFQCSCGGTLLPVEDVAYVEYGAYNGSSYDNEGYGDIFRCKSCGKTIIAFQVGAKA